jgi:predicted transcriptional regulator
MLRDSEEYILIIHDQFLLSAYPLASEAVQRGVNIRTIDPTVYRPSITLKGEVKARDQEILTNALNEGRLLNREMEHFDVYLWMSEKEVAILSFPDLNGSFDYNGFTSKSDQTIKWCRDLFNYYWGMAQPKHELSFTRPY